MTSETVVAPRRIDRPNALAILNEDDTIMAKAVKYLLWIYKEERLMPDLENRPPPAVFRNIHVKLRIGTLLFVVALDNNFVPSRIVSGPGKHSHYAYEVQFFESGSGTLFIDRREIPITPRSVHVIGPNMYHSFTSNPDDLLTRFYIQFTFSDTGGREDDFPPSEIRHIRQTLTAATYCRCTDAAPLLHLVEAVKAELAAPSLGYYARIQSLFTLMIIHIVRSIRPNVDDYGLPDNVQDELRTQVIELYFHSYRKPLTIKELAAQLHLSTKQTNRILHKYYAASFKQKLLDLRIEVAKHLLQTSDLTIQQIAEHVGYTTERYLCKMFSQRTGLTPTQFRKSGGGEYQRD